MARDIAADMSAGYPAGLPESIEFLGQDKRFGALMSITIMFVVGVASPLLAGNGKA